MEIAPSNPIGARSKRTVWGFAGTLVVLGIALLAVNGPYSNVRSLRLVQFVFRAVPVAIAVLLYGTLYPGATLRELLGVALWGYFTIGLAGVVGFFAFADLSSSYPGEFREFVNNVVHFLSTTAVLGGLYAVAATIRNRPLLAGLVLLLVPAGQLVVYAVV